MFPPPPPLANRWLWLALAALHILSIICCEGLRNHNHPMNDFKRQTSQAAATYKSKTRSLQTTYETITGRSCYRSIEGMNQFMKDLAANHPDLVTMETIGESYIKKNGGNNNNNGDLPPGYDIYALNITAANSARQSSEKGKMLLTSGIHAREYTPTELLARFIETLVDGYNTNDAQITSILQHTEIHAIIHVNPDGRYMAENSPNTYWRKNMNPTGCKKDGFYGVDINRNFDFLWGDDFGASSDPCSDAYHGSQPNSEPETQAVVNYAMRVFPESQRRSNPEKQMNEPLGDDIMGMYIDIHSTGKYIYYPWGHKNANSPDDEGHQAIARKISHYNGYDLWASGYDFQYPVSGDSSDFMYAVMGVASLGLELGFNFYEDCSTFENDILPSNLDALLYAASIAGKPFSLAKGPDLLQVIVDYNIAGKIVVSAEVSDGVMVNSLNGEQDHSTGDQDIVKVALYLDVHPDDFKDGDLSWEMSPLDGEFDNSAEIVEVSLSTRDLSSGIHTLHLQPIDSGGYLGPVKSVYIEVEKGETNTPSKYPTSAPTTKRPTTTPPTLKLTPPLTTAEPSRNLVTTTSVSPNPSKPPLAASSEPSRNPTTTPPSPNPSQSPPLTTPASTVFPKITSFPTPSPTTRTPTTPSSTNFPTAGQTSPNNVSLQSTTTYSVGTLITTTHNNSSSAITMVGVRLMMTTTCALTSWLLYQLN